MGNIKGAISVDRERCKGCNLCVVACPTECLALSVGEVNHKGYAFCIQAEPDKCTGCTNCAVVCPDGCISVFRVKDDAR